MASFNKVILIGNLTADPELKQTQNGIAVTSFTIGVSRQHKQGEQAVSDFFNIVCWRNTAEFVSKYFHKGSGILVCGQLQNRSWTGQDGQKRYATDVVADEVRFVDKKGEAATASATAAYPQADPQTFAEMTPGEDLPFE